MIEARVKHQRFWLFGLIVIGITMTGLGLNGCQPIEESNPDISEVPKEVATSIPSATQDQSEELAQTATPSAVNDYQPVWGTFPPPGLDPATPIPEPLTGLDLPDEVQVWVLLGSDTEPPFTGRIQAIHLLFIHPRFSKASLVSIPGDLYVYIPGYTMQRLNTAYAIGGIETLYETLAYNFGVTPSRFVLAQPGDFQWLVDDIDGIEVAVFYPMPLACGGIRAGRITMDGTLALCYASYREGMDEVSRMERQQQLLRVIFRKFTHESYLIKLPLLYSSYEGWIKTDLALNELLELVPLSLRLADPDRIGYFMLGWDAITLWEIPGYSQAQVFLPIEDEVRVTLQEAIDYVLIPEPLTNMVETLEVQLTEIIYATQNPPTSTPTLTPTQTQTPMPTPTGNTPTPTLTPTETPTGYPYPYPYPYP
jgi:LCP family protein required for cell wall assembly